MDIDVKAAERIAELEADLEDAYVTIDLQQETINEQEELIRKKDEIIDGMAVQIQRYKNGQNVDYGVA